jgi:homoserine O-succinyltransferase/O-acetyltransferase
MTRLLHLGASGEPRWMNQRSTVPARHRSIVIGLVNNMPDAALRATERQFCDLLSAASSDFVVRLKLFSLPEIERSHAMRSHIARYYDDFCELDDDPPDGLIVTGMEPRASTLTAEPHWSALAKLVEWVRDNGVPTVWSCMAAHVAVMRRDGIERQPLGRKVSGLFECDIDSAAHEILSGTPERWRVPHSRYNGLRESELIARGYEIVSCSAEAGPDIFLKRDHELSIFFQSHPEYTASALLGEYRRDVTRFLGGEWDAYPDIPHGYFSTQAQVRLDALRERAEQERTSDILGELSQLLSGASQQASWRPTAVRIYNNWLTYLDDRRTPRVWQEPRHELMTTVSHDHA